MLKKKKKDNILQKTVSIKHLLILWFGCVLGFGIILAVATNFFSSIVQETAFGNSTLFVALIFGIVSLGFLAFGLAILGAFIKIIRSKKIKAIINSPVFIILAVLCSFALGILGTKVFNPVKEKNVNSQQNTDIVKQKEPNIVPDEIFELTNGERIKNGIEPLKRSAKLDEAALERAKVIIEYDEWAHEATKSGVPYTEAIKRANYWNTNYGENLASGQYTSAEVVNGWMNSDGHRANILDKKFQEVGIATYSGELNGFSTVVTVQIFGGYQSPNYSQETINGWIGALSSLREIKPSWENIKNFSSTYEANKQDADRMIEIINLRIYRIERIVNRMQANQWLTSEENRWAYDDEKLYNEQEAIANRLNSQVWK